MLYIQLYSSRPASQLAKAEVRSLHNHNRTLLLLACVQVHLAMALRRRESYMDSQAATIKLTCQYRVREARHTSGVSNTASVHSSNSCYTVVAQHRTASAWLVEGRREMWRVRHVRGFWVSTGLN